MDTSVLMPDASFERQALVNVGYNKAGKGILMKRVVALLMAAFLLSSCITWDVNPQPFPLWTAIPTRTPGVVTPTPNIIFITGTSLPYTLTPSLTITPGQITSTVETPTITPTITETTTATPNPQVSVDVLGCDTGFYLAHGMYEVTNAYVTAKNTGNVDLPNTCALLRASDEGREHPDKVRCVDNLPVNYQVTLKLTVDSTYKKDTVIQVDASSTGNLLLRVDKQSCRDINLLGGVPSDVGVIKPIAP